MRVERAILDRERAAAAIDFLAGNSVDAFARVLHALANAGDKVSERLSHLLRQGPNEFDRVSWSVDQASEPISVAPTITLQRKILSRFHCAYLRETSRDRLTPSRVSAERAGYVDYDSRTSFTRSASLRSMDDVELDAVRLIGAATGFRPDALLPLNINVYPPGGVFKAHFDTLHPEQRILLRGRLHRTALIYLNDEYCGGETAFVNLKIAVKGGAGDLLLFTNCEEDGRTALGSMHASLPIRGGEKWVLATWERIGRLSPEILPEAGMEANSS